MILLRWIVGLSLPSLLVGLLLLGLATLLPAVGSSGDAATTTVPVTPTGDATLTKSAGSTVR